MAERSDESRHISAHFTYVLALRRNAQFVRDRFNVDDTYVIPNTPREPWQGGLHVVTNEAMPTFLLMKLSVWLDNTLDILIRRQLTSPDPKHMRFSDKIKLLTEIIQLITKRF